MVLKTYQCCRFDDSSENIHHIEWLAVWAEQVPRIPCSSKSQKLLLTVVRVLSNEHSTGPSVFYTLISVSLKRLDSFIRF